MLHTPHDLYRSSRHVPEKTSAKRSSYLLEKNVGGRGLEPPLLSEPDPKASQSLGSDRPTRVVTGTYHHTGSGSVTLRHARVGDRVGDGGRRRRQSPDHLSLRAAVERLCTPVLSTQGV